MRNKVNCCFIDCDCKFESENGLRARANDLEVIRGANNGRVVIVEHNVARFYVKFEHIGRNLTRVTLTVDGAQDGATGQTLLNHWLVRNVGSIS